MKSTRRPIDDRLASREPRGETKPVTVSRPKTALRIERAEELAVLAVGAMVLKRVAEFGQSSVPLRAIVSLLERATAEMGPEDVMNLEVEAYEVTDWLVSGNSQTPDELRSVARRSGEVILFDPQAPIPDLIRRAIDEGFDLKIDYFSRRRGEMNTRRITPTELLAETYVQAYCHARRADRVFRLNRITRCIPIGGQPMAQTLTVRSDDEKALPRQISLLDDEEPGNR